MISRWVRCIVGFPAFLALGALLALTAAAATLPASPPAKPKVAVHATSEAARKAAPSLPDSVLALVGSQRITARDVREAAVRFGSKPDSLTPQGAREFLDVLIDQKAITATTAGMPREWTARDSSDLHSLTDRIELDTALDSSLVIERARRVAAGDTVLDKLSLGIAVRDAAVKAARFSYDEALIRRVAAAFDTLPKPDPSQPAMEQLRIAGLLPHISRADSSLEIASEGANHYTAGELLADWKRLNPLYRPRISDPSQVKDLIHNAWYEELLRRRAREQHVLERPENVRAIREKTEFLDMQGYVARQVYAKIPMDSLTLRKAFDANPRAYDIARRAVVLRFAFESEAEAVTFKFRLMRPLAVDTLLAEAKREKVDYSGSFSADEDSALVARCFAVGVGGLVGPDETRHGWRMIRVQKLEPARPRTFDEAHDAVQHDWYDREGERMMRSLLDSLRTQQGVRINEAALRRFGQRARVPSKSPARAAAHTATPLKAAPRTR